MTESDYGMMESEKYKLRFRVREGGIMQACEDRVGTVTGIKGYRKKHIGLS